MINLQKNVFPIYLSKEVFVFKKKREKEHEDFEMFLPYIILGNFEMQKQPPEVFYEKSCS